MTGENRTLAMKEAYAGAGEVEMFEGLRRHAKTISRCLQCVFACFVQFMGI